MLPPQDFNNVITRLNQLGFKTLKEYYASKKWQEKRNEFFKRHSYKCEFCKARKRLNLHHKHYYHLGNERMEELMWVCVGCHSMIHSLRIDVYRDTIRVKKFMAEARQRAYESYDL